MQRPTRVLELLLGPALVTATVALASCAADPVGPEDPRGEGRLFVADEGSGTVSVIDEATLTRVAVIDLFHEGEVYLPHNVQASPDGRSLWVTAVAFAHHHGGPVEPHVDASPSEQVLVLDPRTLAVVARIPLAPGLHPAHVVLDAESRTAFVAASDGDCVLAFDAETFAPAGRYELGEGRGPHGMRHCGDRLYVANTDGRSLSIVDPATSEVDEVPLDGLAVQTACAPGTPFVFVTLYDTREVVRLDTATGALTRVALPAESQGPVQLYPTPDGRTVHVADQGHLLGRPASSRLYAVDVETAEVTAAVEVGHGPHGVVVSRDGRRAFVTNLLDGSVSVVDLRAGAVVATVPVGSKPNGLTYWHPDGGMP